MIKEDKKRGEIRMWFRRGEIKKRCFFFFLSDVVNVVFCMGWRLDPEHMKTITKLNLCVFSRKKLEVYRLTMLILNYLKSERKKKMTS